MSDNDEPDAQPARPSAELIYERVLHDARDELGRTPRALLLSALLAGFTVGATPLVVALTFQQLEATDVEVFVASLVYPIGYIAVILGRAQLFTENTLYPAVLSLEERQHLPATARLWAVVLLGNLIGGFAMALLLVETTALPESVIDELAKLGDEAASRPFWKTFWSGVLAGWLLAMVAWLVEATETAIGQFVVIWLLTMLVGLGAFDHCVASAVEVFGGLLDGRVGLGEAAGWEAAAILGNVLGGVLIVSLANYGQVKRGG